MPHLLNMILTKFCLLYGIWRDYNVVMQTHTNYKIYTLKFNYIVDGGNTLNISI